MILKCDFFHSLWIVFLETSRRFDLSSRSLGHVMFCFAGTAQEAGAGGRSIGLPYVQGLSERLSKTFRQHGVSVYHKPVNTLRSILVHPKDKTPNDKKCGVIILYEITCDQDPAHVYIGETKHPLGKRVKEHTNLNIPTRNTPT